MMFPLVFMRRLRRGLWRDLLWRYLRRHLRNDLQRGRRRRRRRRRRRDLNRLLLNSGLFDGVLTLMTLVRLAALRAWPRLAGSRIRRLGRNWRALLLTFLAVIFLVLLFFSLFALRGRLIRGILRDDHRAIVGGACCREPEAEADSANNTGSST